MSICIGIFDNARSARRAMEMLHDSNIALDDLSLISRTNEQHLEVNNPDDVSAKEGATVGALWGGIVGLASLAIPGVGPFIAGGAIATALASAATGAVAGAAVGGVSAALISFGGLPEEEAKQYESLVYAGKTLVAAKANAEDIRHVRRILTKAGAESVEAGVATPGTPAPSAQVILYDDNGRQVAE